MVRPQVLPETRPVLQDSGTILLDEDLLVATPTQEPVVKSAEDKELSTATPTQETVVKSSEAYELCAATPTQESVVKSIEAEKTIDTTSSPSVENAMNQLRRMSEISHQTQNVVLETHRRMYMPGSPQTDRMIPLAQQHRMILNMAHSISHQETLLRNISLAALRRRPRRSQ